MHLLGFRIFGTNRDWARLIRRNHLLSLYNVRYLIAEAGGEHARVIESVRAAANGPETAGANLLAGPWRLTGAEQAGQQLRLKTPVLWGPSQAVRDADAAPDTVYRISLDARGPAGGAANFLQADLFKAFPDGSYFQRDELALRVSPEQIGPQWRHFEWTCRTPADLPAEPVLRVLTMSERPIEVRDIRLQVSTWERPIQIARQLPAGQPVYRRLAALEPLRPGDPEVVIYENLLYGPLPEPDAGLRLSEAQIESLKWGRDLTAGEIPPAPSLALRPELWPAGRPDLAMAVTTLPAGLLYAGAAAAAVWIARRRRRKST